MMIHMKLKSVRLAWMSTLANELLHPAMSIQDLTNFLTHWTTETVLETNTIYVLIQSGCFMCFVVVKGHDEGKWCERQWDSVQNRRICVSKGEPQMMLLIRSSSDQGAGCSCDSGYETKWWSASEKHLDWARITSNERIDPVMHLHHQTAHPTSPN